MVLLLDVGQRQVAILVDEVLDESEVVIRALPAHLRRQAVRGASIMSDGRLFLVLDIAELLADALGGKTAPRPQAKPALDSLASEVQRCLWWMIRSRCAVLWRGRLRVWAMMCVSRAMALRR